MYVDDREVGCVVTSRITDLMVVPVFDSAITAKVDRSGSTGWFTAEVDADTA